MSMKKPQLGMSARKTVGNTVYHIFMVTLSVIMIYPLSLIHISEPTRH